MGCTPVHFINKNMRVLVFYRWRHKPTLWGRNIVFPFKIFVFAKRRKYYQKCRNRRCIYFCQFLFGAKEYFRFYQGCIEFSIRARFFYPLLFPFLNGAVLLTEWAQSWFRQPGPARPGFLFRRPDVYFFPQYLFSKPVQKRDFFRRVPSAPGL